MPGTESVRVVVRVRPLNPSEIARGCQSVIDVDRGLSQVGIFHNRSTQPKTFAFDAVYDIDAEQQLIYDETGFPLVENVLEGYNGTIFAYGQTGCGKTFTMSGTPEKPGVIPNSFKHIFGAISDTDNTKMFLVYCSYIEIYNEEIRDLLRYDPKTKLELKEDSDHGVYIKGVTKESVNTINDINRFMDIGASHRTTKETKMNERSSRSHSIFTVYVEMSETLEDRAHLRAGKLNLVDLAGSERQKKTQATGDRLKEAIEINLSLSALGNVISALVDGQSTHIPYRDSKLTRLLQDSLGGNTKTIMIAVASPADYNYDESLSTLRYASRAKFIQNKPKINEDPKDALLREYLETINALKRQLAERGGAGDPIIVERVVERIVEKRVEVPVYIEAPHSDSQPSSALGKKASKKVISEDPESQGSARIKPRGDSERGKPAPAKKAKAVLEDDDDDASPPDSGKQVKKQQKDMRLVQKGLDDDSEEELRPAKAASKQLPKAAQSRQKEASEDEEEIKTPATSGSKAVKPKPIAKGKDAKQAEEEAKTPATVSAKAARPKPLAKGKDADEEEAKSTGGRPQKSSQQKAKKTLEDDDEDESQSPTAPKGTKGTAVQGLQDDSGDEVEPVRSPVVSAQKGQKPAAKGKELAPRAVPSSPKASVALESDSDNYSEDFAEESFAQDGKKKRPGQGRKAEDRREEGRKGEGKAERNREDGRKEEGKAERTREDGRKEEGKAERNREDPARTKGKGQETESRPQRAGNAAIRGGSVEIQADDGKRGGGVGRAEESKSGKPRDSGSQGSYTRAADLRSEDDFEGEAEQYDDDFETEQQSLHRPPPSKADASKPRKAAAEGKIQLSSKHPKAKLQPQQSKSQEEFEDYGDDFEDEAADRKVTPSESAGKMVPMRGGREAKPHPQEAVRESKDLKEAGKPTKEAARPQAVQPAAKGKRAAESLESTEKPGQKQVKKAPRQSLDAVSDDDPKPQAKARKPTVKGTVELSNSSEDELKESMQDKEARFEAIRQKLMKGGQTQDQEELNRLKEYHRAQLKRQKAVAQSQPKVDKRKAEEEMLLAEHQYASVQEEVENQRHIVKGLQLKYKSAMSEIQDLNHEHEVEKEDLLGTIRAKDRETNFLYQVLEKLITTDQLNMIKQKSKFDDDNNEWRVPAFLVQTNKPLTFPKLPRRQAQELVEADVKGRSLKFQDEDDDAVLRNARFQDWKDDRKRGDSQAAVDDRPSSRGAPGGGGMKAVLLDPLEQAPVVVLPVDSGGRTSPQSRKRLQPLDPSRQMLASDEFPKAGKRSYIS